MRTIKNVTLASNKSGNKLFVQKGLAGPFKENYDSDRKLEGPQSGNNSSASVGVLGNRTGNRSEEVLKSEDIKSPLDFVTSNAKSLKDHARRRLETIDLYSSEAVELAAILEADDDNNSLIERRAETANEAMDGSGMGGPGGMSGGLPSSSNVTDVVTRGMLVNVIDDIIYDKNPYRSNPSLNRILRDMFYHDSTTGSAVNLLSTLPFSEFSLSGLKDEKMTNIFVDSLESMKINSLLPNMSIDYLVMGSSIVSLAYDESSKKFTGAFPHNIDFAHFIQVPSYGVDPIIKVRLEPHIAGALNNETIRENYLKYIPKDIVNFYKDGNKGKGGGEGFELDPKTSIFIARNGTLRDFRGISLLKRAVPAWLYEKALIKGTLDQSYKRQRAIMHITAGDGDEWVPVTEEMQAISNMFLAADLDPLGAIVVTRNGVNVNEVRRGEDFWRWDQNFDGIERIKLRSIGISESFVSGDAAYNSLEQTISVFMDQIRVYRNQFTSEIFYEKIFPMISEANGITRQRYGLKRGGAEVANYGNTSVYRDDDNNLIARIGNSYPQVREFAAGSRESIDIQKYVVPEVLWHKRLMPEADEAYINMLGTLHEKGLPITMRQWAAAGGLNLDNLLEDLAEDTKVRERIVAYRKQITDAMKEAGMGSEEEDPGSGSQAFGEFASSPQMQSAINQLVSQKMGFGSVRKKAILTYGDPDHPNAQFTDLDSQGKRRVMTKQGRDIIANRFTKNLAKAAAEMARMENKRTKDEDWQVNQRINKKKFYHAK